MTIFDVIRYPISMPPTHDELAALPPTLFKEWLNSSDWRNHLVKVNNHVRISERTTRHVAEWYVAALNIPGTLSLDDQADIKNLRRMIEHWGEYDDI